MKRFDWFLMGMALTLATLVGSSYTAHLMRAQDPKRMVTIPCAKGVACREIVVDTAWMQVVEVKP